MPTDESNTPADRTPNIWRRVLPPWAVVLHADAFTPMSYVVNCLLSSVPELTEARATEITEEAAEQGRAHVVTCPLELAELYRERLEDLVLTVTIEKA